MHNYIRFVPERKKQYVCTVFYTVFSNQVDYFDVLMKDLSRCIFRDMSNS